MTITLEAIKTEHSKITDMIAAFEKQPPRHFAIAETHIVLAPGEEYAGIILGKDGDPTYHLVLLPGEFAKATWQQATEWAKSIGGELPTRREQALLYANLKEQFKAEWYWSSEQHASDYDCAWFQFFLDGLQHYDLKSFEGRARAARRVIITGAAK
jgi:hypothetical protein